ncbi:amino acid ABC transporter ATP-binding protein [Weissella sagaensis]|uniref:Amino acid ABC transporter ATP-binding protein n=1 Tax=Weissella sagaensis TaxID=2559928 RepID=A0ABW1RSH2_9LACO|nr:amino acid ABC transporter ATP-binding protein [Weissella sagaensis]KAA8434018.1 amino acid ABC transporter ATP-binding protein [Weissella paramesenteroides]KAA8438212.1 amino acid ABC transporter ATP-binding protein [Weissella paramesenteroides]QDJ58255.1 amino acid ABC transporter ATP-binding protein [Weissella hellenica]QEA57248.1 amino acid ABC transporter ATP-binding protein [Weissella hellenica]
MSMIEFKDVNKFYGDYHALTDINLKVEAGETVVLIGPSGSGKSTLIRTINGLEPVQGGQLIVNGQDLANPKTDMNRTRKNVGMVFQHFNLYANKTVLENIMLAPRLVLHRDEAENKKMAMELLDRVGLVSQANKVPSALSGGQQQRIAIARSLAMKPKALLFDEPTSALDPEMVNGVLQIIKDIVNDSSMTTLVVTHEMGFAKQVADRVIFMDKGQILEDSPTNEFFAQPKEPRAQEFLSQIIR